jgi:hypothetical protein
VSTVTEDPALAGIIDRFVAASCSGDFKRADEWATAAFVLVLSPNDVGCADSTEEPS